MRYSHARLVVVCGVALVLLSASQMLVGAHPQAEQGDQQGLEELAALHPIDAHVHLFKTDPAFQAMLERLNLEVLNILVMDDTLVYRKQLQPQIADALSLMRSSHGRIALCTTFDPYAFDSRSFPADAIKQINQDFSDGALAVKIWKNIGMEIKDRSGKYVMADDPKFQPIYRDIEGHGKTLLVHQAEPDVAWGPPDPSDPSWSYYRENPQWYVADKPGFPSKQAILAARDRILEQNPKLRVVGVHLGSMERSLDDIAQHLDRYPNFAIDVAARMEYLMLMPREPVRQFLIRYQDRILYGTDLDLLATAKIPEALKDWQSTYTRDWKFLATDEILKVHGNQLTGLNLPPSVLNKIFHDNAKRWIPGL